MATRAFLGAWLVVAAGLASEAAAAGDRPHCLGPEQRRAAIAAHKVVPLSRALRAARGRHTVDVVRARLCEGGGGLVYVLTLLWRDGKVTRVTVDAGNGRLIGRR
jgi:uncharacterized membrane protein YkoI